MENILAYAPQIVDGLLITISLGILSIPGAMLIGIVLTVARLSGKLPLSRAAQAYTAVFRGVPELLILFFFYYGIAGALQRILGNWIEFSNFWIAMLALSAIAGAYAGEVMRAAVIAVPVGQWEAAAALGLRPSLVWFKVVLPQAARLALPPLSNVVLILIKDTALASAIGAEELMRKSSIAAGSTRSPFVFFTVAAALYLVITIPLLLWQERLEAKQNPS